MFGCFGNKFFLRNHKTRAGEGDNWKKWFSQNFAIFQIFLQLHLWKTSVL